MRTYPTRPALYRIATIDALLREGRCPNARELAARIEVSRRTIYRDIEYLRDVLGAPVEYDAEHDGYAYTQDGFRFPQIELSQGELLALAVAGQVTRAYAGTPLAGQVRAALERLTAMLPDEISVEISDLAGATSFTVSAPRIADVERVHELIGTVRAHRRIRTRYKSLASGRTAARTIDPYHLVSIDGAWYLVGYCHRRRDVRLFVPERMTTLEVTDETFSPPRDFDVDRYMAGAFRVMRGGRTRTVRLRFRGRSADYVAERRWHATQGIRPTADGGCELTMRLSNLDEVAAWAMSFGADCEVLAPKALRERVVCEMRRAVRRYGRGGIGERREARGDEQAW